MSFHKVLEIREHAGPVYTVACGHGFIYSGSGDKFVTRWNLETGKQDAFAIKFEHSVYTIEVVNNLLFVGLNNGSLHIFDVESRKELKHYTQHQDAIFKIAHNPKLNHVYVGDAEGNFSVWNDSTLEQVIYFPLNCGKIREIAINSEGDLFSLSCQDGTIRIFESKNFNEITTLNGHEGGSTAATFLRNDNKHLVTGGKDARIKFWDYSTEVELKNIPAHNFAVYRLAQIDETLLVSVSRDKTIKIWNDELKVIKRLDAREGGHSHSVNDLAIIDKNRFATCSDDRRVIVWGRD